MTLEELVVAADAAQEKAWQANNAAWAAWQRIAKIADLLRGAADAQQADKKPEAEVTWRQAMGDDLPGDA